MMVYVSTSVKVDNVRAASRIHTFLYLHAQIAGTAHELFFIAGDGSDRAVVVVEHVDHALGRGHSASRGLFG